MPTYPLTALVLKKRKLGETDLILTLLGRDGALYEAVAKGARMPGSKFGGRAEPATLFDARIAKGKSLDVITDAKTLATHHRLREDYEAVLAVGVILEFASTVSQEGLEEPRFFDLTMAVLDALEQLLDEGERTHNADRITLYLVAYLVKGAAMHGYRFDIDEIAGGDVPERVDAQNTARMMRLLTATFAEMSDADSATINDSRQLFEVARTFIRQTIPARFRALDAYLTHLDAY